MLNQWKPQDSKWSSKRPSWTFTENELQQHWHLDCYIMYMFKSYIKSRRVGENDYSTIEISFYKVWWNKI